MITGKNQNIDLKRETELFFYPYGRPAVARLALFRKFFSKSCWRSARLFFKGGIEGGFGVIAYLVEDLEDGFGCVGRIAEQLPGFFNTVLVNKIKEVFTED